VILADTQAIIWLLQNDPKLGSRAQEAMFEAAGTDGIAISAITPWEISMAAAKGRLTLGRPTQEWVEAMLFMPGIHLAPVEPQIGVDAGELPGEIHGDPADRLIIATARWLDCPLMTADGKILDYAEAGHVQAIDARR
jgi:PIN domain nuclease of toxin-antitoxin system